MRTTLTVPLLLLSFHFFSADSLVRQGRYGMGALTVLNGTALDWQWFFQTDLAEAAADYSIPKPTDHVVFRARTQ